MHFINIVQYNELEAFVKDYTKDYDKVITVGIRGSFSVAYTLQRLINEFGARNPDISFNIKTCATDEAIELVSNEEMDFAYVIPEHELPDSIAYLKLAETEQFFLMNQNHHLASKESIKPEMLNNEKVMITNFSNTPLNMLLKFAAKGNACPDVFFSTSDLQLIYQSVSQDNILSMLKTKDIEMAMRYDKKLIAKSAEPRIITHFGLIYRKDMLMTQSRKAFLKCVRDEFKTHLVNKEA